MPGFAVWIFIHHDACIDVIDLNMIHVFNVCRHNPRVSPGLQLIRQTIQPGRIHHPGIGFLVETKVYMIAHCLTISQGGAIYMRDVDSASFDGTTFNSNSAVSSIYLCAKKTTLSFTIQLKSVRLFLCHITISRVLPMSGLGRCTLPTNGHCAESSLPLTVAPFLQHKSTDTHSRTQPLTRVRTHASTHSPTYPLTHYSLTHSLTNSLTHSSTHSLSHSFPLPLSDRTSCRW